jgi:hypothetical protein
MAFKVTEKHVGSTVWHLPKIGMQRKGMLKRLERRGACRLALVDFGTRVWWVDQADLLPIDAPNAPREEGEEA